MRFIITFVALFSLFFTAMDQTHAQAKKRNVVLIIADDLGMDLACYGNEKIKMPNLNKMAKNGVVFKNAYASVASCSASRASILTGMFTHQNGQFGHAHNPHDQTTHSYIQTLPFLLNRAGYHTGLVGKFHVAPGSLYPFHNLMTKGLNGNRDVVAMAEKAKEIIQNAGKKPFFIVHAFSDPHRSGKGFANEKFPNDPKEVKYDPKDVIVPYFLPDRPEVRKELAEYYQSASRLDRGVGLLIDVLRDAGELDNTVIIFISDNGIPFPGAKTTLYDPGVHLPLLISSPDHKKGHSNDALVSYTDLAPTILDIAGAKRPKYKLPGKSLVPILNQTHPKGWDRAFCSHQFHEITMYYPMRLLQTRKYSYIVNLAHKLDYPFASDLYASPTWQGVLKRGDKMMGKKSVESYLHRPLEELYDVQKDPMQLHNLANDPEHAQALQELRREMMAWQQRTNDPWSILYRQGLVLGKK